MHVLFLTPTLTRSSGVIPSYLVREQDRYEVGLAATTNLPLDLGHLRAVHPLRLLYLDCKPITQDLCIVLLLF